MHLHALTGWVLGLGPCGRNCNKSSISADTKPNRLLIERKMNDATYFGYWDSETKVTNQTLARYDITDTIRSGMDGKVFAVSERFKWEQELLKVSLPVEHNLTHKDIKYVH